jgi:hypothetical protein
MKAFVGAKYRTPFGVCWVKSIWENGLVELHFHNGNPSKLVSIGELMARNWPLLNEKEHLIRKFNKYVAESEKNISS